MTLHDTQLIEAAQAAQKPETLKVTDWLNAYYQPAPVQKCTLREMSALEQMYAYYEA